MAAPKLNTAQLDEAYRRIISGERAKDVAPEYDVTYGSLMGRLYRHYGYRGDWLKASTFIPPTSLIDIGYLAGLFDGEGSIFPSNRFYGWQARITMTNEEVMRWLHSLGGALSYSPPRPSRLQTWTWALNRYRDVPLFCETLLPYLRVKRARVEECLEYYRVTPLPASGRTSRNPETGVYRVASRAKHEAQWERTTITLCGRL